MASLPPMRQGTMVNGWKLILNGQQAELFHLSEDPMEEKDLALARPQQVASLKKMVEEWDVRVPHGEFKESPLTQEDVRVLEAAGYL